MNDTVVVVTLIKKGRVEVIMMVYVLTLKDMMVIVGGKVDEDNN